MAIPPNTSTPTAVMEPRIRVRRAQVRKQEGRRRLRVVVAAAAVVATALAVWGALRSPLLDVDRVIVEGASQTGTSTAVKASGLTRRTAMIDVDEGAIRRRLGALAWVRSASVDKEWPGTVRIRLVERTPAAMAPNVAGGWALIDAEGRVLTWPAVPVPGILPMAGVPLAGPPGSTLPPEIAGPLDVARTLPPALRQRVVNLTVDSNGISLGLTPGGSILVGDATNAGAKLRAAELVLGGVDTTGLAVLDVRLPATPTVTRAQP